MFWSFGKIETTYIHCGTNCESIDYRYVCHILSRDGESKKYINISNNQYIAGYILICLIYQEKYIDMFNISREIYRYIRYIGGNISTDYFFLNKHPSSPKHFPHHDKINNHFFHGYFPTPDIFYLHPDIFFLHLFVIKI